MALSFPGEARARVEIIANLLANKLGGKEHVFYDNWYKGDLARFNLQPYLQDIYCKQTLLRVFLARGKRVDKRADIWSWGVVLYELLTGERLFKGDEAADTLAQVLTKEPDWDRAPVQVQRLLQRCLEKDPKKRLRDIGEARYVLDNSVTAPKRSWLAWIAAALLAVAAAGFAALWLRPVPLPQVTRFEIHAPPGGTLSPGTPAISPDGRTIAFTVDDPDGKRRIHLRPIDRIETRALPGTEGAIHPFWSPDGHSLAFGAVPQSFEAD